MKNLLKLFCYCIILQQFIFLMNRTTAERNIVVLLFVFVLVLFSFAQKDTQKLEKLYTEKAKTIQKVALAASTTAINQ
jgi:hypothetical protein